MTTAQDEEALRLTARAEMLDRNATLGPWIACSSEVQRRIDNSHEYEAVFAEHKDGVGTKHDADFVAVARQDYPLLADHLKRLLAEKAEANERRAETVAACDLLRLENERMRKGLEEAEAVIREHAPGYTVLIADLRSLLTPAAEAKPKCGTCRASEPSTDKSMSDERAAEIEDLTRRAEKANNDARQTGWTATIRGLVGFVRELLGVRKR